MIRLKERQSHVIAYLFIGWLLPLGAGALIGDRKGRFGEGIVWTAILGLIGLVIIALRSPTDQVKVAKAQARMRIEEAARVAIERDRSTGQASSHG